MIKTKDILTSAEAASELGFTPDYIRRLILDGKLKAEKIGRNWLLRKKDLSRVKRQRFPKKEK